MSPVSQARTSIFNHKRSTPEIIKALESQVDSLHQNYLSHIRPFGDSSTFREQLSSIDPSQALAMYLPLASVVHVVNDLSALSKGPLDDASKPRVEEAEKKATTLRLQLCKDINICKRSQLTEWIQQAKADLNKAGSSEEMSSIRDALVEKIVTDKLSLSVSDPDLVNGIMEILFDKPQQRRVFAQDLPQPIRDQIHPDKQACTVISLANNAELYLVNTGKDETRLIGRSTHVVKPGVIVEGGQSTELAVKKIKVKDIQGVLVAYKEPRISSSLAGVPGIWPIQHAFAYQGSSTSKASKSDRLNLAFVSKKIGKLERQFKYHPFQVLDLVRALKEMHSKGVIHNDFKFYNVLHHGEQREELDEELVLEIIDFGNSFRPGQPNSEVNFPDLLGGTYPPPELSEAILQNSWSQALGMIDDPTKIDVWAFGFFLLELYFPSAYGAAVKSVMDEKGSDKNAVSLRNRVSTYSAVSERALTEMDKKEYSDAFKPLIRMCLKKDPKERCTMEQLEAVIVSYWGLTVASISDFDVAQDGEWLPKPVLDVDEGLLASFDEVFADPN